MAFYGGWGLGLSSVSSESEAAAFRIDDLLDFSSEEIGGPIGSSDDNDEESNGNGNNAEERNSGTGSSSVTEAATSASEVASRASSPNVVEADAVAAAVGGVVELCVPTDALEELEWLSGFVDDTFESVAEYVAPACVGGATEEQEKATTTALAPAKTWLLGRARSKRRLARSGGSSSGSSSHSTVFVNSFPGRAEAEASVCSRPPPAGAAKKTKQRRVQEGGQGRRCSHCGVQKTPQWRTGPDGPKTLCNACGVRFKSGRLLPEYRPALSPTFSSDIHSNCHRKVIEIRRQKEAEQQQEQEIFA
uniref:GATA transcription factor n=1 Tax=Araucaria cunninghamii TaxID=56994 RepID=A0A0D6QX04_ARACU